jgi:hypothetical protein
LQEKFLQAFFLFCVQTCVQTHSPPQSTLFNEQH